MKKLKGLTAIVSGIAAAVVISILALLNEMSGIGIWIIFSFGATVLIIFVAHDADAAQPKNIFFGHLISVVVGIAFNELFGFSFFSLGLAVGCAVTLMVYFKVVHPPAASNPLVAIFSDVSFDYILFPVIMGSIVIIVLSIIINRFILKKNYPKKILFSKNFF